MYSNERKCVAYQTLVPMAPIPDGPYTGWRTLPIFISFIRLLNGVIIVKMSSSIKIYFFSPLTDNAVILVPILVLVPVEHNH